MHEHDLFDPVLTDLSERHRDEVLTAFAAVEHSADPVPEAQLAALPPEQRRMMESMMAQRGVHMGSMGAGGATVRVCLSKEMVERNEVAAMAQGDCQTQLQPRSGNTMRFSFSCKQPPSSGEGVVTFLGPDSYHSKVNVRDGARGQSMQVEAQAKFIAADCGNLRPLGGR